MGNFEVADFENRAGALFRTALKCRQGRRISWRWIQGALGVFYVLFALSNVMPFRNWCCFR